MSGSDGLTEYQRGYINGRDEALHVHEAGGAVGEREEPLRAALEAITRTVYSPDAPLDSPSYSTLHLECIRIAREALARLSVNEGGVARTEAEPHE